MDQDLSVSNGKELAHIIRSLGGIEAKLELFLAQQEAHEKRIAWLESKANWAIGALAVVSFVVTAVFNFFMKSFR